MRSNAIIILCVFLVGCALVGCAPGFGSKLPLTQLTPPVEYNFVENPAPIKIGLFLDDRSEKRVIEVDGREIPAEGDMAEIVRRGLAEELKAKGMNALFPEDAAAALPHAPLLRGTIKSWWARVVPGFPSSHVQAKANFRIELFDEAGKLLKGSSYSGEAEIEHPLMNTERVQQALNQAMEEAIKVAAGDLSAR